MYPEVRYELSPLPPLGSLNRGVFVVSTKRSVGACESSQTTSLLMMRFSSCSIPVKLERTKQSFPNSNDIEFRQKTPQWFSLPVSKGQSTLNFQNFGNVLLDSSCRNEKCHKKDSVPQSTFSDQGDEYSVNQTNCERHQGWSWVFPDEQDWEWLLKNCFYLWLHFYDWWYLLWKSEIMVTKNKKTDKKWSPLTNSWQI